MCELLVRVVDRISLDPQAGPASLAGNVIHRAPDGWNWSAAEISNPAWVVLKIPGIDCTTFDDMLECRHSGVGKDRVLTHRCNRFFDFAADNTILARIAALPADNRVVLIDTNNLRNRLTAIRKLR